MTSENNTYVQTMSLIGWNNRYGEYCDICNKQTNWPDNPIWKTNILTGKFPEFDEVCQCESIRRLQNPSWRHQVLEFSRVSNVYRLDSHQRWNTENATYCHQCKKQSNWRDNPHNSTDKEFPDNTDNNCLCGPLDFVLK
jgi:hypothetical protein